MAGKTNFDSHANQISKDMQVADNPIPLSPQWLLPKSGENKTGISTGEISPYPANASRLDVMRSPEIGEEMMPDIQKKKDVFRPSVLDMESGRRDRWRDEERDTNSSVRRDQWREGGRELGDNRKVDRWTDSSGKHSGEARRGLLERRTDSSNREVNYDQRRESKWNTRWGPDDKDTDRLREKWTDSSKDADILPEKGLSYHGKDEDGDHYRPWRSNPGRGKMESPHNESFTPNKQVPTFAHGRRRGDNTHPTFALGRGKAGLGTSLLNNVPVKLQAVGSFSDKSDGSNGDPSVLKYSRTKLLDLYRMIDIRSSEKLVDGIANVPSLTQEESLEPLAFYPPKSEELVILKGIDKGDIVSSGAPRITNDGSVGWNSSDFQQSRRTTIGSREDLPPVDDSTDDTLKNPSGGHSDYSDNLSNEKHLLSYGPNAKSDTVHAHQTLTDYKLNTEAPNEAPINREASMQGASSVHSGSAWRSSSMVDRAHTASLDWKDSPTNIRSRTSDIGWTHSQKDLNSQWESTLSDSSFSKDGTGWQAGNNLVMQRQTSAVFDREQETRKHPPTSPEDLLLLYRDPQGEIQGPFAGSDIIGWFEAGYFGIDLQVRIANAPHEIPFSLLGDVMPHLRAKARPPPGFGTSKLNEMTNVSVQPNFGKLHAGSSEIDVLNDDPRYRHSSTTDAENRFLESLMSGNVCSVPHEFGHTEGMLGYFGNTPSSTSSLGAEIGDVSLLAKRMTLERQRSFPNSYPYWSGRDAASHVPKSDIVQDSTIQHPKILPSVADNSIQRSHPQNADLLSFLQGLPNRSATGANNGVSNWSNFPVQGGLDAHQEKLDMHRGQSFPPQAAFGIQQRLQPQNQTPLTNLLAQSIDNSSGMLTTEKLLSSGVVQDPQVLNFLQQQYLLQLQTQVPPSQQLSILDKLLLLKQQQKQEEQQQLLLQQQQLLSQVMSERQPHQRIGEPSYGQLHASSGLPGGKISSDHSQFQPLELFQIGSQIEVPKMQDEHASNYANLVSTVPQEVSRTVASETSSVHLPHQLIGNIDNEKGWATNLPEQIDDIQQMDLSLTPSVMDNLPKLEALDKYVHGQTLENSLKIGEPGIVTTHEAAVKLAPSTHGGKPVTFPVPSEKDGFLSGQVSDLQVPTTGFVEEQEDEKEPCHDEPAAVKEVRSVEVREVRKASEKKSKKHKSSKAHSSDHTRGVSKMQPSKQSETDGVNIADGTSDACIVSGETPDVPDKQETRETKIENSESLSVKISFSAHMSRDESETVETKLDSGNMGSVASGLRAWKPAPGFKPKSLLEIQQEEQRRAEAEMTVPDISSSLSAMGFSTPWAGVVSNSDNKSFREIQQDVNTIEFALGKSESSSNKKNRKSQLHDVLAEDVLVRPSEREAELTDMTSDMSPQLVRNTLSDLVDDDKFIEAKETKKSRKKSAKVKGAGSKVSIPMSSVDVSVGPSPMERGKNARQIQQEKEVMPAIPSGPSLGDFVIWKGESASPSPPPAWSTDSGKLPKPMPLRDILKEQERKVSSSQHQIPVATPQKSVPTQPARGHASWSVSVSSPEKAATPIQINPQASQSKHKGDDDFFWGPLDQIKQEVKQADFPNLANRSGSGMKSTPSKGNVGAGSLNRQKSGGSRPAEHSFSSSLATIHSSLKGKKDVLYKHSEAVDFRDWCESECLRLVGSKDTSFLEFCLKQSRSEAEMLLIENLGSFDPDHEFIDKFLNYKDFLPADVLEISFQSRNDRKPPGLGAGEVNSDNVGVVDIDQGNYALTPDGSSKSGGKKKGKKGKKVSLSALGFNVVSNRIMMGEIQTVED